MQFGSKAILFLATGCGLGRIPKAPGTFGTLLGLPLAYGIYHLNLAWAVLVNIVIILLSIWIAHLAEKILARKDPGSVVIDEIAGMAITMTGLEFNWGLVIFGFVLFRILDILKPFPIGWLDRRLSGGLGIVADDVAAGIIGNFILRIGLLLAGG